MSEPAIALDAIVIGPLNIDLIVVGSAPHEILELVNWMALSDVTLNVAGSAGYPAASGWQCLARHWPWRFSAA